MLGWPSAIMAKLPAAPFDEIVLRDLDAAGINTDFCEAADPEAAPQITVAIPNSDDRAFLSHKSGKAIPSTDPPKGAWRHLHIGELRTLLDHPELVTYARSQGMTISLDCSWDEDLMAMGQAVSEQINMVDVFLPNAAEYDHLKASGLSMEDGLLIVVKNGSKGAQALVNGEWINRSVELATVIDATGAGDAFNGGFLVGWLSGDTIENCLDAGNRCGSAAVTKPGGITALTQLGLDQNNSKIKAAQ
jgi:sugar/nucleoside kinase (ribokinase family)